MAKSNRKNSLEDKIAIKRNRVVKTNLRKIKEREIEKSVEMEYDIEYQFK